MRGEHNSDSWLFLIFVFLLPFQSALPFRIAGWQVQPADIVFGLLFLVWLFRVVKGWMDFRLGAIHLLIAAYVVAAILSTIGSEDPGRSVVKLAGKVYLALIAIVSLSLVNSTRQLVMTIYSWLGGAAAVIIMSLAGIALFYLGLTDPEINIVIHRMYGSLPAGFYPRVEGLFDYPSMFCNFLAVTWILLVACKWEGWIGAAAFWGFAVLLWIVNGFTLTPGLGGIFLTSGIFLWYRTRSANPFLARSYLLGGTLTALIFLAAASFTLFTYGPEGYQ